jgi:ribosomal protein S18 acetylase RimI-like enzyme
MGGRVIQGFFIGGSFRAPGPAPQPPVPGRRAGSSTTPGPPPRAFAGPAAAAQPRRAPGRPGCVDSAAGVAQPSGGGSFGVDPVQLGLARAGGRSLPPALLAKMEAAFGADFSTVRVHIGPQASRIGAIAFTTGDDLYFAPGQFQPESIKGQQLIGHELAHVVQQRQGRVRTPGSGLAVVQDQALEAEADRLGMRAAAHRLPVQAKMAGRGGPPVHISDPGAAAKGSFRVTAGSGANPVGSLIVHAKGGGAAEITDLAVAAGHRDEGIGRQLLESAARAGLRSGNSKLSLSAQDNGSGKLTRWYKEMGFKQVGVNGRGMPVLEAPISRLLSGAVQRKLDPATRPARPGQPPRPQAPAGVRRGPIQRSTMGFEGNKEPTGYGSVSLSATINGYDIGKAWSVQPKYSEDTEHAEDSVADFVQALFLYSEYSSAVPKGTDLKQLAEIMQSIKDKGLNIVINNLTASPCSTTHKTCKKKNLNGCAERLIELMKDYEKAKPSITIYALHYYQPTGIGGGAKQASEAAVKDMQKAGITVHIAKK